MPGPLRRLRSLVRQGSSDAPGALIDALGRIGLVSYGVVHLLVAWLALAVAFRVPAAPADAEGAVATIAATAYGRTILLLVTVGLVAFAVWQLTATALGFRWVSGGERFRKRVGATAKAVAMIALAVIAGGFVDGRDDQPDGNTRTLTAGLLALPAGRVLVGLLAMTVLVIAGTMVYTGVRRTFLGDLDLSNVAPAARRAVELLGAVGTLARALAVGLVGVGLGTAAVLANAQAAGGLDVALRGLADSSVGRMLLVLVAAGFAAFGLFCLADAVYRKA
jgi:hypothetical protein